MEPRFRGRLQLLRDEAGEVKCVCCMSCVKICPTQVITIEATKKEGRKAKLPARYDFEMERCIFCGFCVESCPSTPSSSTINSNWPSTTARNWPWVWTGSTRTCSAPPRWPSSPLQNQRIEGKTMEQLLSKLGQNLFLIFGLIALVGAGS